MNSRASSDSNQANSAFSSIVPDSFPEKERKGGDVTFTGINSIQNQHQPTEATLHGLSYVVGSSSGTGCSTWGGSNNPDQVNLKSERLCQMCSSDDIQFLLPCECLKYCRKCAMKIATGGKCKSCKQVYSTMKRIQS
mmetsp:Transcript_3514/g.5474  ORF Transcript_3514/g.5474 Transcript_3514/m.5474 type:complete len:137 (-) Transcript_3514:1001-1411(-)